METDRREAPTANDDVWIPMSRFRLILAGAIAVAAAAFSAFATIFLDKSTNAFDRPVGWAIFTVFALAGAVGLWLGAWPGRRGLLVTASGFTIFGVLSPRPFLWNDVRDFRLVKIQRNTFVAFDLSDRLKSGRLQRTGQVTIGADRLLPNTLRMEPVWLAELMELRRRQHESG